MEILDGNYDEIRAWILHGQVDCGFLPSIVAEPLRFYPLWDDPLCAVLPENHPLAEKAQISLSELFRYPLIIETPGCDNDIQHLLKKCPARPRIAYSFRDDPLIMAFVRRGLGVTISQELVLESTGRAGIVSRPLEPGSSRRIGLAFSKTTNSVVSRVLLEYLQRKFSNLPSPASAAAAAGQGPVQPGQVGQPGGEVGHGGSSRGAVGAQAGKGSFPG